MLRVIVALLLSLPAPLTAARHVVIISIDGLAAYHLYNERIELPNIRELIAEGVWAASSETVFPSVTHPSHTTILTGVDPRRHGVLSNGMFNRRTGERFHPTNKKRTEIVQAPTLFDAAKAAGMTTASFFWPETRDDPAIDFNLPEVFDAEGRADIAATPDSLLQELRAADVPIGLFFRWYGTERRGAGDVILAEAAAHVIRKHRPSLLAIHFVSTDAVQHLLGPSHYLSRAALTNADHCVGLLRAAVREAGLEDETAFLIVADHGFHSVYQEASVEPAFRAAGLSGKVRLNGGGWTVWVELNDSFEAARDQPALEAAFRELRAAGIVRRVIAPEEMHAIGQPRYNEDPHASGHYALIPDIDTHLVTQPAPSLERRPKAKPYHGHGYLPDHPRMYPALVMAGAGVRRGVTAGHVHNRDIAPTVAGLLGLRMEGLTGRAIEEALEPPKNDVRPRAGR